MASYTVLDLITSALQLIGSLATGETPNADDASTVFFALQAMIDGWNSDRLSLMSVLYLNPTLSPNKQSYTIGPSATDFPNATPLIQLQTVSCIIGGTTARKDVSLLNSVQWASLGEKGLTGTFPDKVYCDYTYPISTLWFHPIPSAGITLDLYAWQILPPFTGYTQVINFLRPGYEEALLYNLALKIYPLFGLSPDNLVVQLAGQYKQNMRALNYHVKYSR